MADAPPPSAEARAAGGNGTPPPLTGGALVLGTFALSLATFMNVLDTSIANVSIPAISGDLGVSVSQGTWVITSFGVANAISVPLSGWLTQRVGTVHLFVASVLLFVLASWLCGLAPSIEWLVAFRVFQGAVAGPMVPLSQTLLLASYPRHRSGTALAMWSMTTLIAPVAGPLLGGWITDNISWPWIFYINIPVGLFAAALTLAIYRHRETPRRKLPVDVVGLSLLVLWVGALQIMLDKGKELDWFASGTIVVLGLVALVGLVVFLVWELTEEHPVIDLSLFRGRNFSAGVAALALAYALFFGNVVILPLWLQQYLGYTATQAGMALAPVGLLAAVFTPIVGRKIGQWDARLLATISFVVFALVLWLRSLFDTQADFVSIVIPTIVQGVAVAFFFVPLVAIVLSGLPPERIAAASGLSNFFRILAGSFGTSISTTLWDHRASMHHAHLAEAVSRDSIGAADAFARLQGLGLSPAQALEAIEQMAEQQAYTLSANDLFYGSALLFVLLCGFIWITRPLPAHR
ncbi:MAG TPA: DHA2 family efflux MFS transporter permease subunit [Burkholderiaceae bacterium]|nr:DHA2 family efflux MFS transporter permease subunit [Burkholderiaceae bacterium]